MYNIPKEWINEDRVKYFDLLEFVSKIKLTDSVLYHVEQTSCSFEEYINTLAKFCDYDDYAMLYYWLDSNHTELKLSSELENHIFSNSDLFNSGLFFEKLSISHERIKRIHKFVCENSGTDSDEVGEYRKKMVTVGAEYGKEYVPYWYAPEASDVKRFMDSYLEFYKNKSIKEIYSNPFLKSALAHLLFVRIHPFRDGNGRTARIIQNISFTSGINRIYNTKLKLSPLNISQNINLNRVTYADRINKVHFDLDYDNNEIINLWLEFILNMYDEQLYFQSQRIPKLERTLSDIAKTKSDKDHLLGIAEKSMIKKFM